jgi:hypothetical protein
MTDFVFIVRLHRALLASEYVQKSNRERGYHVFESHIIVRPAAVLALSVHAKTSFE